MVLLPGYAPPLGQNPLFAENTSAVWESLHGTASVIFGHGVLVLRSMFEPVRQSPTWNWVSCRFPTVGVALGPGDVLRLGLEVGVVVGRAAPCLGELPPSARTSATTTIRMAAPAPAGSSHRGRLRGGPDGTGGV